MHANNSNTYIVSNTYNYQRKIRNTLLLTIKINVPKNSAMNSRTADRFKYSMSDEREAARDPRAEFDIGATDAMLVILDDGLISDWFFSEEGETMDRVVGLSADDDEGPTNGTASGTESIRR